jgi:hypothetical protein
MKKVEHTWLQDPDIASAIKGEAVVGGQRYLYILDPQAQETLQRILVEMKKMNVQLAMMTGEELTDDDV